MDKYPLIGVSICAVVLLILASLTNVVGFQAVQSSNQIVISDEVGQKELLFQTIVDIANNREIQKVLLKSQMSREGFLNADVKFAVFNTPVLTKNQLKQMYIVGLMLPKTVSKSKMHSLLEQYQMIPQGLQKEITTVIEKDATLNVEMTQLSNLNCNCGDSSVVTVWHFPVICTILLIMWFIVFLIAYEAHLLYNFLIIIWTLLEQFNCRNIP